MSWTICGVHRGRNGHHQGRNGEGPRVRRSGGQSCCGVSPPSVLPADFTSFPEENPAVDDRIEITYDPDDPYYVIQAGSDEDQVLAMAFAVAAFCTLGVTAGASVGAVLIHRARAKAARATSYYYY
jgi:hypothetical protein